jgi:hypothetical protein
MEETLTFFTLPSSFEIGEGSLCQWEIFRHIGQIFLTVYLPVRSPGPCVRLILHLHTAHLLACASCNAHADYIMFIFAQLPIHNWFVLPHLGSLLRGHNDLCSIGSPLEFSSRAHFPSFSLFRYRMSSPR